MKRTQLTVKEFSNIVKNATNEVKETFSSPFVVCNLLNKAANGDYSRISECSELKRENVAEVGRVLRNIHKGRYAFEFSFLKESPYFGMYEGRLCPIFDAQDNEATRNALEHGETLVDSKGRALAFDVNGSVVAVGSPVPLTIPSIFSAFCKAAKIEIRESEKAEKQAQREADKARKAQERETKQREREYARMKKGVISDYNKGVFGDAELASKLAQLRLEYAA